MHKCQCNDLVSVSGLSAGKVPGICSAAVGVLLLCVISLCIVKRKGEYYITDGKFFFFSCKIVKTACFKNLVQKIIQVTSILGMYQSFSCLNLGNLLSNLSCFDTCNFLVLGAYLKYFVVIIISHWFQYVLFVILSAVHH